MRAGVEFVPEERKTEGLFLEQSLSNNLIAASLSEHSSVGLMRAGTIKAASQAAIDACGVKTSSVPVHRHASAVLAGHRSATEDLEELTDLFILRWRTSVHPIRQWPRIHRRGCKRLDYPERTGTAKLQRANAGRLLNGKIFYSLREAQIIIENCRKQYNTKRPHSAPG